MNENLDLTQILKGLEGIELYSTIYGRVKITKICNCEYPIEYRTIEGDLRFGSVTSEGLHYKHTPGECTLFPSKDQRDWSNFERPIPQDAPMMFSPCATGRWKLGYYATKCSKGFHVCFAEGKTSKDNATYITYNYYPYMIPFDKFNPNNIEESLKYNIQK